ncbi:MAG TPA: glucose-1-phosphate cytidylyltransferase [Polyangiaceae bacterium]|nr:glucose-1-phosphate cytidylyltransferase [Polyangiaceae bacterium]
MKVVILCGGYGTRIRDVAADIPKPMIPVGPYPILWHIMRYYAHWGHKEFVLCLGHLGHVIKDFILNYQARVADTTVVFGEQTKVIYHTNHDALDWRVTLADTGANAMTGARLRRVRRYVGDEEFLFTYGDGLGDVDLGRLVAFHRERGKLLTVTGVRPPGRFGELEADAAGNVVEFNEKPQSSGGLISGGFFVCSPRVFDYLPDDEGLSFEYEPMRQLVREGQMGVYRHEGFWQPMDTQRDHLLLNQLWSSGRAPWKAW